MVYWQLLRVHMLLSAMLSTFAGCEESELRSGGKKKASGLERSEPALQNIPVSVPCVNDRNSTPSQAITLPPGSSYQLTGEICPRGFGSLSVVFIIDFSQSMEFPANLIERFGRGNDPTINNSCARLKAAQAVIEAVSQRMASNDRVDISIVPFSSEIITAAVVKNIPLADFGNYTNTTHFCGTDALTNYAIAFDEASTLLKSSPGQHKVTYFITDGRPFIKKLDANGNSIPREDGLGDQVDGEKAAAQGREAMRSLRGENPNAAFYSLFLGNSVSDPQEAVSYLNEISGAENVKVAAVADRLADEIIKFAIPGLAMQPASVRAMLGSEPLTIQSVALAPGGRNTWQVVTEPFRPTNKESILLIEGLTESQQLQKMGATLVRP